MATVSVTTTPSDLDPGTAASVAVEVTGAADVYVTRADGITIKLAPHQMFTFQPEGLALTAKTLVGTSEVVTTVTAPATGTSVAPIDRAIYPPSDDSGALADNALMSWSPVAMHAHGRPLLDFTDPASPVVLIAGLYSVTLWVQWLDDNPGKTGRIDFEIDSNGDDLTIENSVGLGNFAGQFATQTMSATWYLPAGAGIFAGVSHDVGAATAVVSRLGIQLIAEAA